MAFNDKPRRPGSKPAGAKSSGPKRPFKSGPKDGGKPFAAKSDEKRAPRREPRDAKPVIKPQATSEVSLNAEQEPERISKLLARAGIASRRDVERMILDGRIKLNGEVLTTPAVNVTFADKIEVDDEQIRGIERTRLWLYHKTAGLVTTNSDPEGRPTVFESLPKDLPRVMSIGRLDINTEGLLLLTNDGGLARTLELPTTGWLRRYRVRAYGEIEQADLDKLKDGIAVDGVLYGSIDATLDRVQGHNVWITMGLREGKNREIKNVLGALGLDVNRLIRISYGPFQLGDLGEGKVIEVRGRMLRDQLGPRLIEEAKANFDAPIYTKTGEVVESDEKPERAPRAAAPARSAPAERERPAREERFRDDGDRRERARDRLDTKKPGGFSKAGGFGKRDDKDDFKKKKAPAAGKRTANVWMAPGAKPLGPKAIEKAEERARKRAQREARGEAPFRGPGKPRSGKPDGARSDGGRPEGGRPASARGPKRDGASEGRSGPRDGAGRGGKPGGRPGGSSGPGGSGGPSGGKRGGSADRRR
jgi:23S rRNA pseudouridine2605 synthase